MNKKISFLCASSLLVVGAAAAVAISQPKSVFSRTAATTHELVLDSSTVIEDLSSVSSNGSFTTKTALENDVEWEYKNAKSNNSGLITLCRTEPGNNLGEEAYLGNVSPITTLESISVSFVGSYVTFYGSIDGVNFERVTSISSSGVVNNLSEYFYVRVCSGNQDVSELSITSLSVSYSCNEDDYHADIRDSILNSGTKVDSDSNSQKIAELSTNVFDSNRSVQSFKFNQNVPHSEVYSKYVWIKLNKAISISDAAHTKLIFYYSSSADAAFYNENGEARDNCTVYLRLMASDFKTKACETSVNTSSFKANVSYTKFVLDLSLYTFTSDLAVLRINLNRGISAGAVYIDDVHAEEIDSYPHFSYSFTYPVMNEENDLSNGTHHTCYNGDTDCGANTEFVAPSRENGESTQSRKTTISSDWKMWNYDGMNVDLKNKSLTFDILATDITAGKTENLVLQILINGVMYKTASLFSATAETGITKTTVVDSNSNTWTRITIDTIAYAAVGTTTSSTNLGFNLGYARTLYIDNLYVGSLTV